LSGFPGRRPCPTDSQAEYAVSIPRHRLNDELQMPVELFDCQTPAAIWVCLHGGHCSDDSAQRGNNASSRRPLGYSMDTGIFVCRIDLFTNSTALQPTKLCALASASTCSMVAINL
jgi:hypothetical protein